MIFKGIEIKIVNGNLGGVSADAAVVSSGSGPHLRGSGVKYVLSQELDSS